MSRPLLEVADIFRRYGPAWRATHAGQISLGQLKVMSAIERCRTAALGGHVSACDDCGHIEVSYNSCRNRHCPKCQAIAAKEWLADREAELLPVPYYHVVFTVPTLITDIAYQNKVVIYDMLFKAAAETLITIADDPKHLGARIGLISVLHTWGLAAAYLDGDLQFFGHLQGLTDPKTFKKQIAPLRKSEWVVYAKRPFGGPEAVLAYLSRYTHRVAIGNSRLIAVNQSGVTFKWKDYRADERQRAKVMTLDIDEFIRRFLIHVLPAGFHRIRHYGLFANGVRTENIARLRQLLNVPAPSAEPEQPAPANDDEPALSPSPCPCCGGRMLVIEIFERGCLPRSIPMPRIRLDSS